MSTLPTALLLLAALALTELAYLYRRIAQED